MTNEAIRPLGVVLIGTGMVAATHVAAIEAAAPHVRLHGIVSRRREHADRLADGIADRTGLRPGVYAAVRDVAADPDVDAAIVITPPNARADLIAPLAAAGKHILLEKPVARDAPEAEALVAHCEAAGIVLAVVLQHRARAASRAAAALIASGDPGPLHLAEIRVPWWRDQGYYDAPGRGTYARDGGGVLITQAIHTLDLALSLTGPVAAVQAMTATTGFHAMEAEDFATAGLRFASGAVGTVFATTAAFPGGPDSITLHHRDASLHLEAGALTVRWQDDRTETHGEAAGGTGGGADPMAFTHAWHQSVIEDFAAAIRTGRPPLVSGRDALAVHRLIDTIAASARTGQFTEIAP